MADDIDHIRRTVFQAKDLTAMSVTSGWIEINYSRKPEVESRKSLSGKRFRMNMNRFAGKAEIVFGNGCKFSVLLEIVRLGSLFAHKERIHAIAAGGVY